MMKFCFVHVTLWQSHQVFIARQALIIRVATELAFNSCSMYICQGYQQYQLFIIVSQAYQDIFFFLFWTSSEIKRISSGTNKSGAALQLNPTEGWESDTGLWHSWVMWVSQQLSLLLLSCVKYFLLTPSF